MRPSPEPLPYGADRGLRRVALLNRQAADRIHALRERKHVFLSVHDQLLPVHAGTSASFSTASSARSTRLRRISSVMCHCQRGASGLSGCRSETISALAT